MKYTLEEEEFLAENYPKFGAKYCSMKLNRGIDAVTAKANRENLYCPNREIHDSTRPVTISQFLNIQNKEVAYFLGYFWADGYVHHYCSGKTTYWRIAMEIVEEDAMNILPIMEKIGKWSIQKRRRGHWKPTWTFVTNNKSLYSFLEKRGYKEKSKCEPTDILASIPEYLHLYFWRGYFDGDGSCGKYGKSIFFEVSSTYSYKYEELSSWLSFLPKNGLKIYKSISKRGHSHSVAKVYGIKVKLILHRLLLSEIGLYRKTIKMQNIINND